MHIVPLLPADLRESIYQDLKEIGARSFGWRCFLCACHAEFGTLKKTEPGGETRSKMSQIFNLLHKTETSDWTYQYHHLFEQLEKEEDEERRNMLRQEFVEEVERLPPFRFAFDDFPRLNENHYYYALYDRKNFRKWLEKANDEGWEPLELKEQIYLARGKKVTKTITPPPQPSHAFSLHIKAIQQELDLRDRRLSETAPLSHVEQAHEAVSLFQPENTLEKKIIELYEKIEETHKGCPLCAETSAETSTETR